MQATWGAENKAPDPVRGGELYGEKGRWKVNNVESIADVFTRADPGIRGADDAETKFFVKQHLPNPNGVQSYTHKNPSEADLLPTGLHAGMFAHPDKMTMNDHDLGLVWPPPKGEEWRHANFMGMVKEPAPRTGEVNGIMVGYKGHVPRSRDKVGSCPLGKMVGRRSQEGFPHPDETLPSQLPAFGAQTSNAYRGEHPLYVSVAMAHGQSTILENSGEPVPNRPTRTVDGNGYIPRFAGHKPKAYDHIGSSVHGETPQGQQYVEPSHFEYKTIHGNYKPPQHGRAPMMAYEEDL